MARESGALTPRDTNRIARDGDVEFAWEHAKENVQPARRGRDASALRDALRASTRGADDAGETREAMREKMWDAATRARGAEDDALGKWCGLIKWTEQTYATGNGRERELLPVLERCTRELQEVEAYKEDARYLASVDQVRGLLRRAGGYFQVFEGELDRAATGAVLRGVWGVFRGSSSVRGGE